MMHTALLIVNFFTLVRFVFAGAILVAAAAGAWGQVFVYALLAFSTDWADGAAARKFKVVSGFGKFMDPLADKAVCHAVLWPIVIHYNFWPYWLCAILIACYDTYTMSMRMFVRKATGTVVAASKIAKLKTGMLMLGLQLSAAGVMVEPANAWWKSGLHWIGLAMLLGATLLAAQSFWHYAKNALLPTIASARKPSERRHVRMRRSVTKLDYKTWKRRGITCLLLDIEGTITPWNSEEISQDVLDTFAAARTAGISDIALISNIPERDEYRVQNICKKIGVTSYWIPRRSSDRKPAPTMLRYAMDHFKVEPNHVAYVGDKFVDVVAGRRAGVAEIVWVRRLGRSDHPLDYWLYRPLEPIIRQFVSWFKI